MTRVLLVLWLFAGFTCLTFAQAPTNIPYQAVARDASGNLLQNQSICVQYGIYTASTGGTLLYQEHQTVTTNSLGLFTLSIGAGTRTSGTNLSNAAIGWGSNPALYIEVDLNTTGTCSGYTTFPRTQMMSVPFALYAANSGSVPSGNLTDAGTDGITVTSGTGAVVGSGTSIAQQKAGATTNGYLSSTDWSTFNSKQNTVALTTTGSSGAATFNSSTGALNIPNYTLSGLGLASGTGIGISGGNTINNTGLVSLTTTGNSGAASVSGTALNIPNYTLSGLGLAAGSGISLSGGTVSETLPFTSLSTTPTSGAATISGGVLTIPNYTLAGLGLTAGNGITISGTTVSDNIWTLNSNNIYNTNTGNIGIGTSTSTSLYQTLNVYNAAGLYSNYEKATSGISVLTGQTTSDYILYMGADKTNALSYIQSVRFGVATASLALNARGGNVGIGLYNPSAALHVVGTGIYTGELYVNSLGTSIASGASGAVQIGDGTIAKANGNSFWMNSGLSLGAYSGTNSPTNGLIVSGNTAVGNTSNSTIAPYVMNVYQASGSDGLLINAPSGTSSNANIFFETYSNEPNPAAAIEAIDDAAYGAHISFWNRTTNTSTAMTEKMRLTSSGNLCIGTTTAVALLTVGSGGKGGSVPSGYFYNPGGPGSGLSGISNLVADFQGNVLATAFDASNGSFTASSDARIKKIEGVSNGNNDLNTLRQIQITNYKYIDSIGIGTTPQKKVIAQQLETVYPQAVKLRTGYIPDIYAAAEKFEFDNASKSLKIYTGVDPKLNKGDRLEWIDETGSIHYSEVADVEGSNCLIVSADKQPEKIFVYGREVNDFRTVDYDAISMLNVSATQELARRLAATQTKNEALESEIAKLKNENCALNEKFSGLSSATGDIQLLKKQLDDLKSLMEKNGIRSEK